MSFQSLPIDEPKQITDYVTVNSAVMYVVPLGKIFRGFIHINPSAGVYIIGLGKPQSSAPISGAATTGTRLDDLVLLGGTKIVVSSTNGVFISGYEE